MMDNQSACFDIRMVYGDLCGFRNEKVIWIAVRDTQSAYCFSQWEAKGILAKFSVKQSKEQVGVTI